MCINEKNFYEALIYISKSQQLSKSLYDYYLCVLMTRVFIAILLF